MTASSSLFQIYSSLDTLKAVLHEVAALWQPGDAVLLLGVTAAYLDWFNSHLENMALDDEAAYQITEVQAVYVLRGDLEHLDPVAMHQLDSSLQQNDVAVISDAEWVDLTQRMTKVVTING